MAGSGLGGSVRPFFAHDVKTSDGPNGRQSLGEIRYTPGLHNGRSGSGSVVSVRYGDAICCPNAAVVLVNKARIRRVRVMIRDKCFKSAALKIGNEGYFT